MVVLNFICLVLNFHSNWINLSKLEDQIELLVIERSKNWNSINFEICHKFFFRYTLVMWGNKRLAVVKHFNLRLLDVIDSKKSLNFQTKTHVLNHISAVKRQSHFNNTVESWYLEPPGGDENWLKKSGGLGNWGFKKLWF